MTFLITLNNIPTNDNLEQFLEWWDNLDTSDQKKYLKFWLDDCLYSVMITED